MRSILSTAALLALVPFVAAHGRITDPPARAPGTAFKAACGEQVFNTENSDQNGNIQQELQISQGQQDFDATKCNIGVCKGFQFADNSANVQAFTAGQTVAMKAIIAAPHSGTMNVSVLNTQTGALIGDPLIFFADYASNAHTIPANNTAFSVTMPDVSSQCGTAGVCALQWWWNAADIKQTYESCVDFTMGGGSGTAAAAPAASSASAAAPSSTTAAAPAATSAAAAKSCSKLKRSAKFRA